MYKRILRKRILKGLVVALALFAVIPVVNAAAKPVSLVAKNNQFNGSQSADPYYRALFLRSEALNKNYGLGKYAPLPTEIFAGLTGGTLPRETFGPTRPELQAMTARGEGMNQRYHLGRYAQTTGGTDSGRSGAGIGVGIVAALLLGTAAALAVRNRRHGGFAH